MTADRDPLAGQIRRVIERAASDAPDATSVDVARTTVVPLDAARAARTRWMLPAAALLLVSLGAGAAWVALASRRDDDAPTLVESTPATTAPDTTTPATTPDTTTPDTTATTATPTSTVPPKTPPTSLPAASDAVLSDPGDAPLLPIEVLWETTVGSGPDQLGEERDGCSSCVTPWAPLVLRDGTLVIADDVNRRWMVVTDGQATATPLAAGDTFAGQPVLGPDQYVYAPILRTPGDTPAVGDSTASVVVLAVDPFAPDTPFGEFPLADAAPYVRLVVDGVQLTDGGTNVITTFVLPAGPATATRRGDAEITVTAFGHTTTWQLDGRWIGTTEILGTAADGTTVVRGGVGGGLVGRLAPDGTVGAARVDGVNMGQNGSVTLTDAGVVRLEMDDTFEHWRVVRHSLPPVPGDSAPPCTADDVSVRLGQSDGAMGTQYLPLIVTNASTATCRVPDAPTIVPLDAAGDPLAADRVQLADPSTPFTTGPLLDGVLYPGASAASVVRWSMMCSDNPAGGDSVSPTSLQVGLGDGAEVTIANTGVNLVCGLVVPPFEWTTPDWPA